jgi:hypothetical protein
MAFTELRQHQIKPLGCRLLPYFRLAAENRPKEKLVAEISSFVIVRSWQRLFLFGPPVPHVEGVRDHPRARLQVLEQLRRA